MRPSGPPDTAPRAYFREGLLTETYGAVGGRASLQDIAAFWCLGLVFFTRRRPERIARTGKLPILFPIRHCQDRRPCLMNRLSFRPPLAVSGGFASPPSRTGPISVSHEEEVLPEGEVLGATHQEMANAIRVLAMDAVEAANSGHPGMPMGMADVATVLFTRFLKFDPATSTWPDRDRFVLSAGHGSMLLYALLHLTGYPDMTMAEIKRFRQIGSKTAGHPEYGHAQGIETTTGPLGQGLGNAVGMAIAEKLLAVRFGKDAVDHYTYAIAGDGCLMEGISHEAISLAGHLKLGKLIVLFDDNQISIDGPTSLSVSDDQVLRFKASGWDTAAVDGHDPEAVAAAIARARTTDRPSLIACRTIIGYGAPKKAGTAATHGAALGGEEVAASRVKLGWSHAPFFVPDNILSAWRHTGSRGASARREWESRIAKLDATKRAEFDRLMTGELPKGFDQVFTDYKRKLTEKPPTWATRKASQEILEVITAQVPEMIGGSADLTGSNNTKTKVEAVDERHGAARRHHSLRRHLPGVHRLLPPLDPPLGPHGPARRLCHEPRFDRPRRRRTNPSASRTSRGAARDSQSAGVPPGRRGRDGGVLAAGAQGTESALHRCSDATKCSSGPHCSKR
jgi:transketolase N-terminal domain/subunit